MASTPKQSNVHKKWPVPVTFIKFLVGDFKQKFRLPPYFVKKFDKLIPKVATLKSRAGKSSVVSVISDNDGYFFKLGWEEFVKNNDLEMGDILVFNLVDERTFEVLIYGPTCCLKNTKHEAHQDHETPASTSRDIPSRKRGRKPGFSPGKTERKAKRGIKLKRTEGEAMEAGQPNHAYFVRELKEYQKYSVVMPKSFAVQTGLVSKKSAVIKDPEGREWPVDVRVCGPSIFLSSGWADLHEANGLAGGNTLIFHYVQANGGFINLEISRSGSRDGR